VFKIIKSLAAIVLLIGGASAFASVTYDGSNGVKAKIFTSNTVSACTSCHFDGAGDTAARFGTHTEAIVYGNLASSYVNSGYMPYLLDDLTTNEKNLIAAWVSSGMLEKAAPTVTVDDEADLTVAKTTATLSGTIDPNGAQPSVYTFRWGTSSGALSNSVNSNTSQENAVGSGGGGSQAGFNSVASVSTNISSLTCGTRYYYTLGATNTGGTNTTSEKSFTTNACNSGPTISTSSLSDATEQTLYQTTIAATDPEDDDIDFALTTKPTGMTIDANTGVISWTPTEAQSGSSFTVTVTATDSTADINQTDTETYSINAIEVNDKPNITSTAGTSATEDIQYSYQLVVTDDDDSSFSYQLLSSPSGMAVSNSGEITWTPTNGVSTSGTVIVEVSDDDTDNEQTDSETFTISVTAVNDPPVITSSEVTSATEDSAYSYDVDATDEEGVSPAFSLTTKPTGMTINSSTGEISWTPTQSQIGGNSVVVSVTDGNTPITQSFTVTVAANNDTPVISTSAVTSATESTLYQYDVDATDEENDTLTYSLTTKPSGMTIDADSGEISWTPSEASSDYSENVVVSVSDSNTAVTQSFSITVSANNDTPVVTTSAVTSASESTAYQYDVDATDNENDGLTFSLTTKPSGMSIDGNSGEITWTPPEGISNYTEAVVVSVSDTNSSGTQSFTITVTADDDAPVFTSSAVTSGTESVAYSYTAVADDGETNSLTYALVSGPAGMTVGSSGLVSWTPAEASANYTQDVEISVSDASTTVNQSYTITVTADDDTPTITSSAVTSAVESIAYSYDVEASDNENDSLTFSLSTKPSGMTINSGSGLIAWTPPDSDNQYSENVVVEVSDGNTSSQQSFTITVSADADAPFFTSTAVTSGEESVVYSYQAVADDNQNDALTYSLTTFPSGMTIDPDSGQISWTPPQAKAQFTENVVVSVTDGSFSATQNYTITVSADDDTPTFTTSAVTSGQENVAYQYDVDASDSENDSISFSLSTNPSGMTINSDGVINWTPPASLSAYSETVTVDITDGNSTAQQSFSINVSIINDPPSITSTAATSAIEDVLYQYQVAVSDPDDNNDGSAITFSLANAPTGMTVSSTGLITWTPTEGQGSVTNVVLTVADGGEDSASSATETFSINVTAVNDAPIVTSSAVTSATESVVYSYQVTATDAENDTLSFSVVSGPTGLSIDANTGEISWTPAEAGSNYTEDISIQIDDGSDPVNHDFTVNVSADNDPPIFTSSATTSASEGQAYSYDLAASDNENDSLTYSLTSGPSGMALTGNQLTWTPDQAVANYQESVIVAVSDSQLSASQSFTITVTADNDAPVFDNLSSQVATESSAFLFDVNASDPESESLTFSLDSNIGDMSIDSNTGVITWTPREESSDFSETVNLSVTDDTNTTSASFTINVSADNDAPVITSSPVTTAVESTSYQYDVDATDNENQTLNFSLGTAPSGMTIDANGVINWVPDDADANYDEAIIVNISDGTNTTPHSFTLSVIADADTPIITSGAVITAEEGNAYSYQVTATDGQNDTLTFSLSTFPTGMTINASSGLINWTPPEAKTEFTENVEITVSDGSFSSQQSYTITISADDDAPTFTSSAVTQAIENQTYNYDADASDNENDAISFSLSNSPSGMTIDSQSGLISWQPPAAVNNYTESVSVLVTDGNSSSNQSFEINVTTVNDSPSITSTATTTAIEDVPYEYQVGVTDPDDSNNGSDLTFTLSNAPTGMSVSSTGLIQWTPTEGQLLASNVVVTVADGGEDNAQSASETFTIVVTGVNDGPQINSVAITSAVENQTYTYQLVATDPESDTLTFSLSKSPTDMTIDAQTGLVTWLPPDADASFTESVVVVVTDGAITDSQSFDITVSADADAPTISSSAVTNATESVQYTYSVVASDLQGDDLSYSLTTSPTDMSIDAETGVISWLPPEAKTSYQENVTLVVTDGTNSVSQSYVLSVSADDDAPQITSSPISTVGENETFSYQLSVSDLDSSSFTYQIATGPSDANVSNSGLVTWTAAPSVADYQETFELSVSDGANSVSQTFALNISVTNDAPVITSTPESDATEDELYSYQVIVSDPDDINDGVALTFSLAGEPEGLTISATGLIEWTPEEGQVGEFNISVTVSDGEEDNVESDTQSFVITVTGENDAPEITSNPATSAVQYEVYSYQLLIDDPDDLADELTFVLSTAPEGMTVSSAGVISWTPELGQAGDFNVTVSVSDGGEDNADTATQSYVLTVNSVNLPPTIISDVITTAVEDMLYQYQVTVEDADDENNGTDLTFTLNNAPDGMAVSSLGLVTWTPTEGILSAGNIELTVSDGGESGVEPAKQIFDISVTPVNDAPVIISEPPLAAVEAQIWTYELEVSDPDDENNGEDLIFNLQSDLGDAITLSDTGVLSWTPLEGELSSGSITVTVSDGGEDGALSAVQSFEISVTQVNQGPELSAVTLLTATEDETYTYQLEVSDQDDQNDGESLIFELSNAPSGMSVSVTGEISWTPQNGVLTSGEVTISVVDGGEDNALPSIQTFEIQVTAVNDAPVFESEPVLTATEDETYQYEVEFSDIDNEANELILNLLQGPDGMTLEQNTVSWTPVEGQLNADVILQVNDGNLEALQSFSITVTAVNDAPEFTSEPVLEATEDQLYQYQITTEDAESDELTLSLLSGPNSMTLNQGLLEWTPVEGEAQASVVLFLSDGQLSNLHNFEINVTAVNDAPVIPDLSDVQLVELNSMSTQILFTDVDSNSVNYSLANAPEGMNISSSGLITWLAPEFSAGEYQVTVRVDDGADVNNLGSNLLNISVSLLDEDEDTVADYADNCPSIANQSQTDLDQDGLGDLCDNDDDGDGLTDEVELVTGLDPNDATDATLDADNDGLSNLDEFLLCAANGDQTCTTMNADNVPPNITVVQAEVTVDATGYFTDVTMAASALDVLDGEVEVSLSDTGPYVSGRHALFWRARDKENNTSTAVQILNIKPLVELAPSQVVGEDQSVDIEIKLTGDAPSYPVVIEYQVSGTADVSDTSLEDGELTISEGNSGLVSFDILADQVTESDETVIVTLSEVTGDAVLKPTEDLRQQVITIVERNVAPELSVVAQQGDIQSTTVYRDQGVVTLTANVFDANQDTLSVSWTPDVALPEQSSQTTTFSFSPASIETPHVDIDVAVSDGQVTTSNQIRLFILAALPTLSADTDSDNDGIPDSEEGVTDSDNDKVPDYLDSIDDPGLLAPDPTAEQGDLISTDNGLQLALGDLAAASQTGGAQLNEEDIVNDQGEQVSDEDFSIVGGVFDFEVSGLNDVLRTAQVVIPLSQAIPNNAVYRKFNGEAWLDFVIDADNAIASASKVDGLCPTAESDLYQEGLNPFDVCIRLTLSDGGPNDADGLVNGVIKDPGGVAIATAELAVNFEQQQLEKPTEQPEGGGGSLPFNTLVMILAIYFRKIIRRHK